MHLVDDEDEAPARAFSFCVDSGPTGLSPLAQVRIGAELRAMYADLREEPLPDRLLQPAQQLERAPMQRHQIGVLDAVGPGDLACDEL